MTVRHMLRDDGSCEPEWCMGCAVLMERARVARRLREAMDGDPKRGADFKVQMLLALLTELEGGE